MQSLADIILGILGGLGIKSCSEGVIFSTFLVRAVSKIIYNFK